MTCVNVVVTCVDVVVTCIKNVVVTCVNAIVTCVNVVVTFVNAVGTCVNVVGTSVKIVVIHDNMFGQILLCAEAFGTLKALVGPCLEMYTPHMGMKVNHRSRESWALMTLKHCIINNTCLIVGTVQMVNNFWHLAKLFLAVIACENVGYGMNCYNMLHHSTHAS